LRKTFLMMAAWRPHRSRTPDRGNLVAVEANGIGAVLAFLHSRGILYAPNATLTKHDARISAEKILSECGAYAEVLGPLNAG